MRIQKTYTCEETDVKCEVSFEKSLIRPARTLMCIYIVRMYCGRRLWIYVGIHTCSSRSCDKCNPPIPMCIVHFAHIPRRTHVLTSADDATAAMRAHSCAYILRVCMVHMYCEYIEVCKYIEVCIYTVHT